MKIIGLLMKEHIVIKRVVKLTELALNEMENTRQVDLNFVNFVCDFMRDYADKLHHGKEERILFRELDKKNLSNEHKAILDELVEEHKVGRKTINEIACAAKAYVDGDDEAIKDIIKNFEVLTKLYPAHIEKEDKTFFIAAMNYFNEEEKQTLFDESEAFDEKLALKDYVKDIEAFEKNML